MRTLTRFVNDNYFGGRFKMNISAVFVGGFSAGGNVATNLAYMQTQSMINEAWGSKIQSYLGDIDEDWYYGGLNIVPPVILACANMWGGLLCPYKSSQVVLKNWFANKLHGKYIPSLIGFCGYLDPIVAWNNTYVNFPDHNDFDQKYWKVNRCPETANGYATAPPPPPTTRTYNLIELGSGGLYDLVKGLSTAAQPTTAELYVDCNALHGIRPVNKATYGTTYISENATYIYLATRIATYFQAVISPTHIDRGLSDTQFYECENYRHGCDPANNHASPNTPCDQQIDFEF